MKTWFGERKEIEKYYKSLKGQFPELEKELERLISVEDEIGVLVSSRRSMEVIVSDFCEKELKRPRGTEPLKGIIDKLNKEKKIPSYVNTSMINLNSLSTYGAHPKTFNPRQVKTVLLELLTIIEWYIAYLNIDVKGIAKDKPEKKQAVETGEGEEDEYIGKKIDNYKLLESVGEGGMGTVYMAEQTEPVKRKVALKIIKLGMDTKEVVARFRAEQQALAVMDHPNIAQVYDAGATHTGRPYFVMELIRGVPITKYCDNIKLTTHERLEIFISICKAVQHAHQKGIIHRDLKPSNILLAEEGDKPVVKIIDFGIAKAIDHRLTEQTLHTLQGQLIGTPEYMSPEQAERSGLDIDTRADIFSLGVILYELIGGILPFDPKTFQDTGLNEIQEIIREVEPPKVSTRISKLGDTQTSIANLRRTNPASLQNQLKGDLDWITMKAMSKDRSQRYGTATELAADIERHLKNEPILACPPSKKYLLKKYIARHKVEVVAAIIVILAVIVGFAGTTIGMIKAKKAEIIALEEAETAKAVSGFLVDLFEVSDPNEAKGDTVTAREILDKGAEKIEKELEGQALVQTRLMSTMGRVYSNLGLFDRAEEVLESAMVIQKQHFGEESLEVAYGINLLAMVYIYLDKYNELVPLCREALQIMESSPDADHVEIAYTLCNLGWALTDLQEYEEAESVLERSIMIIEEEKGPDDFDLAFPLYNLGWLLNVIQEYDRAKQVYERSMRIYDEEQGSESKEYANCLSDLGTVHQNLKEYDKAYDYLSRSLAIREKILGPVHVDVSDTYNNLGVLFWFKGDFDQARVNFERTLEIREEIFGSDHSQVASVTYNLALIHVNTGNYDEAIKFCNRAISIYEEVFGPDNANSVGPLFTLAYIYNNSKRYKEAKDNYMQVLAIREATLGPDHPQTATAMHQIAITLRRLAEYDNAIEYFERAAAVLEKDPGSESMEFAKCLLDMAITYAYQDNSTEAIAIYRRSTDIIEKLPEPKVPDLIFSQACFQSLTKNRDEAIQYLKQSLELGFIGKFYEDPRLAILYDDSEFKSIVAEYKEKNPGR